MQKTPTPPLAAIFTLSAAALGYEVLLVRLFSIIHWHHFAFMIISIALLGYGASGSLITLFQKQLLQRFDSILIINIMLFGVSSIVCFMIAQQMPFNALEILWDNKQWLRLMMSYLLLTLPFFFVSNAIALSMVRFHSQLSMVYGVDLVGAGVGAVVILWLLQTTSVEHALQALSIVGFIAGLLTLQNFGHRIKIVFATLLILLSCTVLIIPGDWIELRLSEYKGLQQTLLVKGVERLGHYSDSMSQVDVVASKEIPFRHAPGMSLKSPAGAPEQLAVFRDGDEMSVIDHVTDLSSQQYQDYLSSALPYHVMDTPRRILLLGAATGSELQQAATHASEHVDAVEDDAKLTTLITYNFADYSGWNKISERVSIHTISARGFVASTNSKYDLIIFATPGASTGGAAGVHALATSYNTTVEAIESYIDRLTPGGLLSITQWTSTPPRSNLRLFATSVRALDNAGVKQPGENIAWIRSWNTATLLIKNGEFSGAEIENIRQFSTARAFDIAWLPDVKPGEVNRYQLLQQPVFYLAAEALLSDTADDFIRNYKFDINAVSDDAPYPNNFFKWSSLPEFLSMPGRGGIAMIDVGYPTLLATLFQAVVAASALILLPLLVVRNVDGRKNGKRSYIVIYFFSIGLAFLFIEIAFIQKFTLILSQPLYAVAVALCAFLIFSGFGSLFVQSKLSKTDADEYTISSLLRNSVIAISSITIIYLMVLPALSNTLMAMSEPVRIISAFVLAAPIAFFMGMPFPLGLARIHKTQPRLVPWAWGINGCASVLSAILAIILAMEIGFNGVMLCAVVLYLLAWLSAYLQIANIKQAAN